MHRPLSREATFDHHIVELNDLPTLLAPPTPAASDTIVKTVMTEA